jgi:hypothetical protein
MKLSDFSPLAGMLTGEGATGKLIAQGFGGMIPAAIAKSAQRDIAEEEKQKAIQLAMAIGDNQKPMKKGGSVSAPKRADGCAQRGKTRGKMI